jgi:hypothetical protein
VNVRTIKGAAVDCGVLKDSSKKLPKAKYDDNVDGCVCLAASSNKNPSQVFVLVRFERIRRRRRVLLESQGSLSHAMMIRGVSHH